MFTGSARLAASVTLLFFSRGTKLIVQGEASATPKTIQN